MHESGTNGFLALALQAASLADAASARTRVLGAGTLPLAAGGLLA